MYLQGKEREVSTMGMEKAIASGKEHRKPYRGSKAIDCTCRNHGSCGWCLGNRMYKYQKNLEKSLDKLEEMGYNVNRKRGNQV
jgi:hypothetical protein